MSWFCGMYVCNDPAQSPTSILKTAMFQPCLVLKFWQLNGVLEHLRSGKAAVTGHWFKAWYSSAFHGDIQGPNVCSVWHFTSLFTQCTIYKSITERSFVFCWTSVFATYKYKLPYLSHEKYSPIPSHYTGWLIWVIVCVITHSRETYQPTIPVSRETSQYLDYLNWYNMV